MLGLNHSVRNTPVSSKITKLHSAISPNMKDQWSGKTLRSCFLSAPPRPSRSSSQVTAPLPLTGRLSSVAFPASVDPAGRPAGPAAAVLMGLASFPITWSNGLLEVAHRDQEAFVVDTEMKLWKPTCCRSEDDLPVLGPAEGRLGTRAPQVVGLLLIEADRTAHVSTDLGVAQDPVDSPVLAGL